MKALSGLLTAEQPFLRLELRDRVFQLLDFHVDVGDAALVSVLDYNLLLFFDQDTRLAGHLMSFRMVSTYLAAANAAPRDTSRLIMERRRRVDASSINATAISSAVSSKIISSSEE
jgi:hypothetical protein